MREGHRQVFVDLGREPVDAGAAQRDCREEIAELVVHDPDVGHDHGGPPIGPAGPGVHQPLQLIRDGPVFLFRKQAVADDDQDRGMEVEVARHLQGNSLTRASADRPIRWPVPAS